MTMIYRLFDDLFLMPEWLHSARRSRWKIFARTHLLGSFLLHQVETPLADFLVCLLGRKGDVALSSACFSYIVL